jgi:hypothetical protein
LAAVIQANPFPLFDPSQSFLVARQNIIQGNNWPGTGNLSVDPMFVNISGPMTAANIRSNLMLLAGSPAIGTGPNGIDMGALVPAGASISGVPASTSSSNSLNLRVAGPGIVAYRWKLNEGSWSPEISLTNSFLITPNYFNPTNGQVKLQSLPEGTNTFSAIGKSSAGTWQATNAAAVRTWVVETTPALRIDTIDQTGGVVVLSFQAEAGKSYSVLFKDALGDAAWEKLKDIAAPGISALVIVTDETPTAPTRFYRLVTPAQP